MKALTGLFLLSLFVTTTLPACAGEWVIDKTHSSAQFEIRHLMFSSVSGTFNDVTGEAAYDGKNLHTAAVTAQVGVQSLDTHIAARDSHIKEAFDYRQTPLITFKSEKIEPRKDGTFQMVGMLTMHNVSKQVVLNAQPLKESRDKEGVELLTTSATTELNRKDFGIVVDKAIDHGGAVIGDKVQVTLQIALRKKQ